MGKTVAVFGGDGFVGRYAVQALLRDGWRVRVASRRPKRGYFLKAQANLGQIAWTVADVTDPSSVACAVESVDAVVNLVGSFADMDRIHVHAAEVVAAAAREAGATALVHVSAIGADADSQSSYGRTKSQGEAATRSAFPGAAILRPSIIFGREDSFINRFAGLMRLLPVVPVIGGSTRLQPVFAGDVGRAISAALAPSSAGQTYELGGPDIMSMAELNRWIAAKTGRDPTFVEVPDAISSALASLTGWMPGAPITRDQWLMLQRDNVVAADAKGLNALGIAPVSLDLAAEGWLVQFRRHGRFGVTKSASL